MSNVEGTSIEREGADPKDGRTTLVKGFESSSCLSPSSLLPPPPPLPATGDTHVPALSAHLTSPQNLFRHASVSSTFPCKLVGHTFGFPISGRPKLKVKSEK